MSEMIVIRLSSEFIFLSVNLFNENSEKDLVGPYIKTQNNNKLK